MAEYSRPRKATGSVRRRTLIGSVVATGLLLLSGCQMSENADMSQALQTRPVDELFADAMVRKAILPIGQAGYDANCAACHGGNLTGNPAKHAPNLVDSHWLWSGTDVESFEMHPSDIERIIQYGIRSLHPQTRKDALMPGGGAMGTLTPAETSAATDYVLAISGRPVASANKDGGAAIFHGKGGCYDCHGEQGEGDPAIGATDLTRPETWLYGTTRPAIHQTIEHGAAGRCPAFDGRLDRSEIKAISIYVMSRAPKSEL